MINSQYKNESKIIKNRKTTVPGKLKYLAVELLTNKPVNVEISLNISRMLQKTAEFSDYCLKVLLEKIKFRKTEKEKMKYHMVIGIQTLCSVLSRSTLLS